jgi:anti-sigma regulatory factor (Ser/Thr protein kinase)
MAYGEREFDGELRQLASMRAFLREVCQECRQDEDVMHRLELALSEAASNIILHGYEGQQHKSIALTIEADVGQVSLTLRHSGKPFDPETAAEPVFDGSKESGFGLYLIRQCVDDIQYRQDDQGRCVMHMVLKRKDHKGESDGASS